MYIAPPPLNSWQCVVVDRQRNVLQSQSASLVVAEDQIKRACVIDPVYCNPQAITCRFNGQTTQLQTCLVVDEIGQRWMAQGTYQPCLRALAYCQQTHAATQRYNFHCRILS
jgi:hypothetical protein